MAMEGPHPGIVGFELQHQVPGLGAHTRLDQLRVSPQRILKVDGAVPVAYAFGQDPEIVPVQMHRVGSAAYEELVLEDDADGAVGAEIVDVPLRVVRVGCVA